jgi:hypothetical protein
MSPLVKDWRKPAVKQSDAWLANLPGFSRPICEQLREWIFRWDSVAAKSTNSAISYRKPL